MPNKSEGHRHLTPEAQQFLESFRFMIEYYEDPIRFFSAVDRMYWILNESDLFIEMHGPLRRDINHLLHSIHEIGYQWMDNPSLAIESLD